MDPNGPARADFGFHHGSPSAAGNGSKVWLVAGGGQALVFHIMHFVNGVVIVNAVIMLLLCCHYVVILLLLFLKQ